VRDQALANARIRRRPTMKGEGKKVEKKNKTKSGIGRAFRGNLANAI